MRMVDQHGNPWGGGVKNEADDHDHNGDDDEEWCNEDGTRMKMKSGDHELHGEEGW